MGEYRIRLDDEVEEELLALLGRIGAGGYFTKHLVGFVNGKLRAEVRSNEHPPPHFHITYNGEDASYSITTGNRLPHVIGLEKYDPVIHIWWKMNRHRIVAKWNSSRPSDCPVGEVEIPEDWE